MVVGAHNSDRQLPCANVSDSESTQNLKSSVVEAGKVAYYWIIGLTAVSVCSMCKLRVSYLKVRVPVEF